MADRAHLAKAAADLAVLYEISLSVGQSLDLKTNCERFLRTLMARRNLAAAAVWLREDALAAAGEPPPGAPPSGLVLVHASPQVQIRELALSPDHPAAALARGGLAVSVAADDAGFAGLVTEREIEGGVYALFPLGRMGLLKLHSLRRERPYPDDELQQLESVVSKFAVSLAGCLAHRAAVHEVAERKRAEQALREQHEWLTTLINAMPDIVCLKDGAGRWIVANDFDVALFELEGVDYRGRTDAELACESTFYREAFLACGDSDEAAWRAGRLVRAEEIIPRPDGTSKIFDILKLPLFHPDGRRRGLVVVGRDITELHRAEEDRRKLEAQVQHAQKLESLGVMAGGVAHDFNNLLTGILGNASLALMLLDDAAAARHNVEQIEVAALRAAELTNQLLAYSGKGRFVVRTVDLAELVYEMAHLLETAISKKAVLRFELGGLPGAGDEAAREDRPLVEGDPAQIRQVVMNLITNASDALLDRPGTIVVHTGLMEVDWAYVAETYLHDKVTPGTYAFVEVRDSGIGMDEATKARIFEPFFTTKFTGRGLGLAAVLGIVRGHRGALRVDSEPGHGTTFRVLFPRATGRATARPPRPVAQDTWRGTGTVLVVDDDPTVLEVAEVMLERFGFSVVTASDGPSGLVAFRANVERLAAVLLDLTMPGMSGDEVFREMRRIRPDIRVILSSGFAEQDATSHFAGLGLAGFIQKPYQAAVLLKKLRESLATG